MTLHIHVVPESENDRLDLSGEFTGGREDERLCFTHGHIDGLEDGDGEGCCFTSARLSLCNDIPSLSDWQDSTLLNS